MIRVVRKSRLRELESFVEDVKHSSHCVYCPGMEGKAIHHPSYEITPGCNLNCVFCYAFSTAKAKKLPKAGYYGEDKPKAVTVSQYGEPTLIGLEKLEKLFRLLRERFPGVRIDLQTNGVLLSKPVKADITMVSLSTGSRESYAKITGVDCFDKVVRALEFSDILRTVFLPGINSSEVENIARLAKREMLIQPCSIHPGLKERLESLNYDFEKDTLYDYLDFAERASMFADVRLPGCLKRIVLEMLESVDFEDLAFSRRSFAEKPPEIRREWKFRFDL